MSEPQRLGEPVSFGNRYWLTELLAVGGMAEIYLARQDAMAGFEKDIVIKRLKPELAADPRVAAMFLDEARICAALNHPNVVHVYDVEEHEGVPFIAMEYIRGEELNNLCRRGLKLGNFLPLAHAVELIRQAAAGLGYFHARRDAKGRGLDIVHLDISPTNLLVTEDGFLKVIDFGIARAANQRFRDEHAIPGKLSYMSPEQARRDALDHRSDIFSLGIVLYEITVGKRLFKGPAAEVVRRLTEDDVEPPTFSRRTYPGPLEAIVMRCLERHPDDRYQSAYDLADALEDFLREARLRSGPVKIARYLDALAEAAGGERRPELVSEAEIAAAEAEDDLDFDRGVFSSYQPAQDAIGDEAAAEWDEYEESDEQVAAALGMDPEQFAALRTPVPTPVPAVAMPPKAAARKAARERGPNDDDNRGDRGDGNGDAVSGNDGADAHADAGGNDNADGNVNANPDADDKANAKKAPVSKRSSEPVVPIVVAGGLATVAVVAVLYFLLL